jgi:hypothetical protein
LRLTCQRTTGSSLPATTGTLTKTSGIWDNSLAFTYYVGYRCIGLVDWSDPVDLASYRKSLMYNMQFNKLQFAIGMIGGSTHTPRFKDFIWVYNDILNDL